MSSALVVHLKGLPAAPALFYAVLGFDTIDASTDVPNAVSVRVMEKLGMAFRRRAVVEGLDTFFYSLRRDDWRKAGQGPVAAGAPQTRRD